MKMDKMGPIEGKPDWSLFPFDAAEGVVRVLMQGAKKYDRDNWRKGTDDPEAQREIFNSMMRHAVALQRGETLDPQTGEHHVLHLACNALFLSAFAETHKREADAFNDMLSVDLTDDGSVGDHVGENLGCGDPDCFCNDESFQRAQVATPDRTGVEDISGMNADFPYLCDDPTCQICY